MKIDADNDGTVTTKAHRITDVEDNDDTIGEGLCNDMQDMGESIKKNAKDMDEDVKRETDKAVNG